MRKQIITSVLALAGLALAAPASATIYSFEAFLDGLQEVPPNATPATGFGTFVLDDVADTLSISLEYDGLLAPATNAHIHLAPPGVAGPVIIPFLPAGFVVGLTSGTFVAVIGGLSDVNEAAMVAGNTYVNIHTSIFPGGEIRGQLIEVPEPATLSLLGFGLLGLLALRRRA